MEYVKDFRRATKTTPWGKVEFEQPIRSSYIMTLTFVTKVVGTKKDEYDELMTMKKNLYRKIAKLMRKQDIFDYPKFINVIDIPEHITGSKSSLHIELTVRERFDNEGNDIWVAAEKLADNIYLLIEEESEDYGWTIIQ